jgi:hypothetical protein
MTLTTNKRQTTVTMNQILTQKWFVLQNINDSYYVPTSFACLTEFRQKFQNLN